MSSLCLFSHARFSYFPASPFQNCVSSRAMSSLCLFSHAASRDSLPCFGHNFNAASGSWRREKFRWEGYFVWLTVSKRHSQSFLGLGQQLESNRFPFQFSQLLTTGLTGPSCCHVCGTLLFTCFTCCDMDLTTQVWLRLPRLPWQSDASGRWHGKKGLLRVSVHAVSVHTVVDDYCHWQ